jgi:hypothetical protein
MSTDTEPITFLPADAPIPIDRPFTRQQARSAGVSDRRLAAWVHSGLLVNPLRGVFHAAQMPDGLELRLECLGLVVPAHAVVTGRTAGWLHRAPMILAPGDHLRVPSVEMHLTPGNRLRNPLTTSGERTFLPHEIVHMEGILVTSKLRTAVDLGMGLRRVPAYAAMCALAKVADYELDDLLFEVRERGRFAGYRGIRQCRCLAPHVRSEYGSPAECALGDAWLDQPGMPALTLQHPVSHPEGTYYLDLSCPALRYGAEFNGPRWHGEDRKAYDAKRIAWLVDHDDWIIDVFETDDVYGPHAAPGVRLRRGVERARQRFGGLSWQGQSRDGDCWLG